MDPSLYNSFYASNFSAVIVIGHSPYAAHLFSTCSAFSPLHTSIPHSFFFYLVSCLTEQGVALGNISMQKNQTLSPGSSRTPISTSLSNMENPQTYFHANGTDKIKSEPNIRPLEANSIYEIGGSSASESKVKSRKKIKMHRFAFQTRSQVDILDDGYRWRKYGQKAVKDCKFPRSVLCGY